MTFGILITPSAAAVIPSELAIGNSRTFTHDDWEIEIAVTGGWGDALWGFTRLFNVTITNNSDKVMKNWMLAYDNLHGNIESHSVKVEETSSGLKYLKNMGWGGSIEPGSSWSFPYSIFNPTGLPQNITLVQEEVSVSANDYEISVHVDNDWGATFNGHFILSNNTNQPLEFWEINLETNFDVTNTWSAPIANLGDGAHRIEGTTGTNTHTIAPNSSQTIGFVGAKANGIVPEILSSSLSRYVVNENVVRGVVLGDNVESELERIGELNEGAPFKEEILFDEAGVVYSIDGKFSNISVVDSGTALNSLGDVKNLTGINNPTTELRHRDTFANNTIGYKTYLFEQVYKCNLSLTL